LFLPCGILRNLLNLLSFLGGGAYAVAMYEAGKMYDAPHPALNNYDVASLW